ERAVEGGAVAVERVDDDPAPPLPRRGGDGDRAVGRLVLLRHPELHRPRLHAPRARLDRNLEVRRAVTDAAGGQVCTSPGGGPSVCEPDRPVVRAAREALTALAEADAMRLKQAREAARGEE